MRRYIENIQDKSDNHKRRFALVVSGMFTLLIFSLWSMTTFGVLLNTSNVDKTQQEAQVLSTEVSPLDSIWSDVSGTFSDIKGQFNSLKESAFNIYGR